MADGSSKEIESPVVQRAEKSAGRLSLGTRIALTGAALGFWGIGAATTYVENAIAYQETRGTTHQLYQDPVYLEDLTSQKLRVEFTEVPKRLSEEQLVISDLSKKVEIAPRTVLVSDIPEVILSLEKERAEVNQLLQQKKEELPKDKSNPEKPAYMSEAEFATLNNLATYLENLKKDLTEWEKDFDLAFEEGQDKLEKDRIDPQNRLMKYGTEGPVAKTNLLEDLTLRLNSQETLKLYDRGEQEVVLSEQILKSSRSEQDQQNARTNLALAQDQKNLMQHFYASLHHDRQILESEVPRVFITEENLETVRKHALERPKWLSKYWELEKERSQLGLDQNKKSDEYKLWVENEYSRSLKEINKYHTNDLDNFFATPEGRLFYVSIEKERANQELFQIHFLEDKHKDSVRHQKNIFEKSAKYTDEEKELVDKIQKAHSLSPDELLQFKTSLKAYVLARAWNNSGIWGAEVQRLQRLGQDQTDRGKKAEKMLKESYDRFSKLNGNKPFSVEGDLISGLRELTPQLPDENFADEAEMPFLSASLIEVNPLEKEILDLDIKVRSLEAEANELTRIKEGIDQLNAERWQIYKTLEIGIQPSSKMMSWSKYFLGGTVYLNIFGETGIERQRRVELSLEDLRSQQESPQNKWAKERITTYKKLFHLTKSGERWLDFLSFKQMIGEPGHYQADLGVAMVGQSFEIMSNLHEIGHAYFHQYPFPISGHPEHKWNDGTGFNSYPGSYEKGADRSKMSSAYRQFLNDVDSFKAQKDAGDLEPLRRWLNMWPDYHLAEADMVFILANFKLSGDNPFAKYFDQFLEKGDFQSMKELASWYETVSEQDKRYVKMYINNFNDPHSFLGFTQTVLRENPSFRIKLTGERNGELDNIFEQKKKLLQQEERQALLDFGDQLPIYLLNSHNTRPDYIAWQQFERYWDYYLNNMVKLYKMYPDLLKQTHPTAHEYLERYRQGRG